MIDEVGNTQATNPCLPDGTFALRFLTDGKTAAVFFCDRCGKRLDKGDPGEVVIADLEQFVEDVDSGQDRPDQCEFLCATCHEQGNQS